MNPYYKMTHRSNFKERALAPDIAEEKFKEYCENSKKITYWKQTGFDERKSNMDKNDFFAIPYLIRAMPDFFVIADKKPFWIEVKGCRAELRVKKHDLLWYSSWNLMSEAMDSKMCRLFLFIYSTHLGKEFVISYDSLVSLIEDNNYPVFTYPDSKKEYYRIDIKDIENAKKEK